MPDPVTGILGAVNVGGSLLQSGAAKKGTRAQQRAYDAAIAEQRRAESQFQQLLNPYIQAGTPALRGLMDIAGIGTGGANWQAYLQANPDVLQGYYQTADKERFRTPEDYAQWHYQTYGQNEGRQIPMDDAAGRQDAAYRAIEASPGFQAIARQGEEGILQNASATGGLRGGNTQGALARFRPALLDQFIERQFGRLSNIAGAGQGAATNLGNAGVQLASNIGSAQINRGQATAAGAGAQGMIFSDLLGSLGGLGAGLFKPKMTGGF